MTFRRLLLSLIFLISSISILAQGFSYSFTDPCTFKTKQIYIDNPNGNIALIYNSQIKSFTPQQLIDGSLEKWVDQVNSTNPSGPCSGIGLAENTNMNAIITQNNIAVLTNVLTTLTDISSMNGMTSLDGVIGTTEKQDKKKDKKKTEKNDQSDVSDKQLKSSNESSSTTTGSNQTDSRTETNNNTTGTGTKTVGTGERNNESRPDNSSSNTTTQNGKSETGGTVDNKNNNETKTTNTEKKSDNNETKTTDNETKPVKNNSLAGILGSIQTKEKLSNTKKGNLMMNGDIVVIRSANTEDRDQLKVNLSIINSNTKNTFAKGALLNFTSSINNSCLTFFSAWRFKKSTSIIANSSMLNFQKDFFNTTSLMESYKIGKVTATMGINLTTGNLGKSNFKSFSSLGGIVGSFNINKKIGITPMVVVVYSPYVYFYQGIWYKSGWLLVPFTAVDYRLTKKFKFNLSFSGVQQINSSTINFQLLVGAKTLL